MVRVLCCFVLAYCVACGDASPDLVDAIGHDEHSLDVPWISPTP